MSVRAKFKVDQIHLMKSTRAVKNEDGTETKDPKTGYSVREDCELRTIIMSPVFANGDPNHENSKFWAASPGGKLELNCINEQAYKQFELGKEYYIDFTPTE